MTKGIFIMFVLLLFVGLGVMFLGFGSGTLQNSQTFVSVPEDSSFTTSTPVTPPASSTVTSSPIVTSSPAVSVAACKKTGCSSQVCADEDVVTDCMYREEYMCYQKARCERQKDGKCGWTLTPEVSVCLMQYE